MSNLPSPWNRIPSKQQHWHPPEQNLLADLLEYGLNPNKKQKPSSSEDKAEKQTTDKSKVDSSSGSSSGKPRSKLVKRPGRPKGGRRKWNVFNSAVCCVCKTHAHYFAIWIKQDGNIIWCTCPLIIMVKWLFDMQYYAAPMIYISNITKYMYALILSQTNTSVYWSFSPWLKIK